MEEIPGGPILHTESSTCGRTSTQEQDHCLEGHTDLHVIANSTLTTSLDPPGSTLRTPVPLHWLHIRVAWYITVQFNFSRFSFCFMCRVKQFSHSGLLFVRRQRSSHRTMHTENLNEEGELKMKGDSVHSSWLSPPDSEPVCLLWFTHRLPIVC